MKILSMIYPEFDKWVWQVTVQDRGDFFTENIFKTSSGFKNSIYDAEDNFENAKKKIKNTLEIIRKLVMDYKTIKSNVKFNQLWEWDNNNNEFKEIKEGC